MTPLTPKQPGASSLDECGTRRPSRKQLERASRGERDSGRRAQHRRISESNQCRTCAGRAMLPAAIVVVKFANDLL
jgi:hypothetical protein